MAVQRLGHLPNQSASAELAVVVPAAVLRPAPMAVDETTDLAELRATGQQEVSVHSLLVESQRGNVGARLTAVVHQQMLLG